MRMVFGCVILQKLRGKTTAYMAEMWGVYEGLSFDRRKGISKLIAGSV